jgi:hypothetical protein
MESWSHPSRTSPILSLMTAAEQLQASLSFVICFDKSAHCHYRSILTFDNQQSTSAYSFSTSHNDDGAWLSARLTQLALKFEAFSHVKRALFRLSSPALARLYAFSVDSVCTWMHQFYFAPNVLLEHTILSSLLHESRQTKRPCYWRSFYCIIDSHDLAMSRSIGTSCPEMQHERRKHSRTSNRSSAPICRLSHDLSSSL